MTTRAYMMAEVMTPWRPLEPVEMPEETPEDRWLLTKREHRRSRLALAAEGQRSGGSKRLPAGWTARMEALYDRLHRGYVEDALRQGKAVPPAVLADYPDLVALYAPAA